MSPKKLPGPFYHTGGPTGVLMVHGFTGSAYVFEELALRLNNEGYTTYACLLRGHGTTPEDMETVSTEEWVASAVDAYDKLQQSCSQIVVIGASFGGLIAASLSLKRTLAGLIMVGTPLELEYQGIMRLGAIVFPLLGKRFYEKGSTRIGINYYEKGGNDFEGDDGVFAGGNHSYRKVPVRSMRQLLAYLDQVPKHILPEVTAPALVFQSRDDGLIKTHSGERILKILGSTDKQMVWINHPHHHLRQLLAEPDVYRAITDFLTTHLQPGTHKRMHTTPSVASDTVITP